MTLKAKILLCFVLFSGALLFNMPIVTAQNDRTATRHALFSDTLNVGGRELEKSNIFYDSLKTKQHKSWFMKMISKFLITGRNTSDASVPNTELEVSRHYFSEFTGKQITEIRIVQANVFERDDIKSEKWIDRFINSIHVLTKEKELQQNLLFEVGDTIQPYRMAINERLIRNLPYITTSFFVITQDRSDPNGVIVNIFARDSWTISGNANIGSKSWIEAYDRNFIGTGNQLSIKYYIKQKDQADGFEANYDIDNLWGTFANVELGAGVGYTNNKLLIKASRPFILPNDHIFGLIAGQEQTKQGLGSIDTTLLIKRLTFAAWYGYSFVLDKNQGTNLYFTTGVDNTKYNNRPDVTATLNPYYHNRTTMLLSVGLARQNFFQGNMIYGYGRTEDIPFGYRFDVTSGLMWDEFHGRRYYVSASARWGDISPMGYFNIEVGYATFLQKRWQKSQGLAKGQLRYFTPLFRMGSHYIRQFFNLSAIWGFNRFTGEREMLSYSDHASVRGMSIEQENLGYNRFTLGGETVLFTPLFFYHFRFAFNIWGDVGWLGCDSRMFENPLSASAGIGVRIKNERLIFNSISIRFGFAVKKPEFARYNPFQIISEQPYRVNGFEPTMPTIMPYE